jgi:exopolysaccharide biosynthesis polyprenyl glycosylphosphotransferase
MTSATTVSTGVTVPERVRLGRFLRRSLVLADTVSIAIGHGIAYAMSARIVGQSSYLVGRRTYAVFVAVAVVVFLITFAGQRLWTARYIADRVEELRRVAIACVVGAASMWVLAFLADVDVSRGWTLAGPLCVFVCVIVERSALRMVHRRLRSAGVLVRPVLVIGTNDEAAALRAALDADPALGYRVMGVLDPGGSSNGSGTSDVEGHADEVCREVLEAVRSRGANGVILVASALELSSANRLVRQLTRAGVHVELSSTLRDIATGRISVRPLAGFPILAVAPVDDDGWHAAAKRTFDIVVAVVGLVVASPLLVGAAIAVKASSKGPVLFRQERIGRDGTSFHVLKLRTMVVDAERRLADIAHLNEADGPLFKMRDDPRVTRVGRFLRRTSIDEIPQLVNVLRGEMSIVGPRPALAREVAAWPPDLHERLRVRPGITGMWQVEGRGELSFDDYGRYDLYYVDNWSLASDVAIVLRTVPAVLSRRGAH